MSLAVDDLQALCSSLGLYNLYHKELLGET